jgi:hypothetical protein
MGSTAVTTVKAALYIPKTPEREDFGCFSTKK